MLPNLLPLPSAFTFDFGKCVLCGVVNFPVSIFRKVEISLHARLTDRYRAVSWWTAYVRSPYLQYLIKNSFSSRVSTQRYYVFLVCPVTHFVSCVPRFTFPSIPVDYLLSTASSLTQNLMIHPFRSYSAYNYILTVSNQLRYLSKNPTSVLELINRRGIEQHRPTLKSYKLLPHILYISVVTASLV